MNAIDMHPHLFPREWEDLGQHVGELQAHGV